MDRLASLTTLKYAPAGFNRTAYTTPLSCNKTHHIPSMALHSESGPEQTKSALIPSVNCEEKQSLSIMSLRTKRTGFHTV